MLQDLVHGLLSDQCPRPLLDQCEAENASKKQENDKQLLHHRYTRVITVADRCDGRSREIERCHVDLPVLAELYSASLDPLGRVQLIGCGDVTDCYEGARTEVQKEDETDHCDQDFVEVFDCNKVALVSLFQHLGPLLEQS